jgi:protein-L-isoaspartate(D-aspartate) O-methyltransferase
VVAAVIEAADYKSAHQQMLREIERTVGQTRSAIGREALDVRVLQALADVPRHEFVPAQLQAHAYENRPLPIGYGQTISQPYIVALMTDLLQVDSSSVVLEVGTGSGYQAAIMGALTSSVYSIEIVEPLGQQAAARLNRLGFDNVRVRIADGYYGWEEHAPYDAIIVTAAGSHVPPPLIRQLKSGGRMVIPVGGRFMTQQLLLIKKEQGGSITTRQILPVAFVPLTGGH